MGRKTGLVLFTIVVCICGVFLFKDRLIAMGMKRILRNHADLLSYRQVVVNRGVVAIHSLQLKREGWEIDCGKLELQVDSKRGWRHLPTLFFPPRKGKGSIETLFFLRPYISSIKMDQGLVTYLGSRYWVTWSEAKEADEVGTLSLASDPGLIDHPFLLLQLRSCAGFIDLKLVLNGSASPQLLEALSPLLLGKGGEPLRISEGEIALNLETRIDEKGGLLSCTGALAMTKFEMVYSPWGAFTRGKLLEAYFSYPAFVGSVKVEGGGFRCSKWSPAMEIDTIDGEFSIDQEKGRSLCLSGVSKGGGEKISFSLEGGMDSATGNLFGCNVHIKGDKGGECPLVLSFWGSEKGAWQLQLEWESLFAKQIEMLKKGFVPCFPSLARWNLEEGSSSGKCTAFFEKKNITALYLRSCSLYGLVASYMDREVDISALLVDGDLLSKINFQVDLTGKSGSRLFGNELAIRRSLQAWEEEKLHFVGQIKRANEWVEVMASLSFEELAQTVQFGYLSDSLIPKNWGAIREGWVRSGLCNHYLYAPFIALITEDVELYGDVDLIGSYDGNELRVKFQAKEFLAKHPLFDLKAAQIGEGGEGCIELIYAPSTQSIKGMIPLREAEAFDRSTGVFLRHLDADLTFSHRQVEGHIAHASISFDGSPLLDKVQGDLSVSDQGGVPQVVLRQGRGLLALKTDKEYWLSIDEIGNRKCDIALLDGTDPLFRLEATREGDWIGDLSLPYLSKKFQVECSGDLFSPAALFSFSGEGVSGKGERRGSEVKIEELKWQDLTCNGSFHFSQEGIILSALSIDQIERGRVEGFGDVSIDLCANRPFSLSSRLNLDLKLAPPFSLNLEGSRPLEITFSKEKGLLLSQLDFVTEGCRLAVPQIAYSFSSGKLSAPKCALSLSQEQLAKLYASKVLPPFLQDLHLFSKGAVEMEASFQLEGKEIVAIGMIEHPLGKLSVELDWSQEQGNLSIGAPGKKRSLTFQLSRDEEGFHFEGIRGSFGPLVSDLKKWKKGFLRGEAKIDFDQLQNVVNLPMNPYLQAWGLEGNCTIDGTFLTGDRIGNWMFNGMIQGKKCKCLGRAIGAFEAKINMDPGRISFEDLEIQDEMGRVWISEGILKDRGKGEWEFNIPVVEVRKLKPQFFYREEHRDSPFPLFIKSASFFEVKGVLDDLSEMTCMGTAYLSPQSVKMATKISLPERTQGIFYRLGFDVRSLFPASGGVDCAIKGGRFYFKRLNGVMNQGRLCRFVSPPSGEIGYIDFKGNLSLDLQVEGMGKGLLQKAIPLQVRGTWNAPELIIP